MKSPPPARRRATSVSPDEADERLDAILQIIVRNVAKRHNKSVTFMPKPLFGDNGSGMHTHMSLWKDGKPLFAGNGYAGLSEMALFFIGGSCGTPPP